jgi:hypothetical protein
VAVLGAFALALALPASSSAALLNIGVYDDYYDPDSPNDSNPYPATFDFVDVSNDTFNDVEWSWGNGSGTSSNHDVVGNKGMFKSGDPKKTGTYGVYASGGTYKYLCTVHTGMNASFGIRPNLSDPSPTTLKLIWANKFTETGKRFDVRYRIDDGKWKLWLNKTKKTRQVFGKNGKPAAVDTSEHDYFFEVRTYKGKPAKKHRSGWSPAATTV